MNKNIDRNGMSRHPIYKCWYQMNRRCYSKKDSSYERYGGIGVTVCEEWKNDFEAFRRWAENKWNPGLTIDKDILCEQLSISPKTYSPRTCQFVTPRENGMASSHTIVNDEMAIKIIEDIRNNENLFGLREKLSKKYNLTRRQMGGFLSSRRTKIEGNGRGLTKKVTKEQEELVFSLKNDRYTYKEIATKTGINWSTCRSIVNRLNKQGYKL